MKIYIYDDEMIDELYTIIRYIQSNHRENSEVLETSYEIEDAVIKIRESLGV